MIGDILGVGMSAVSGGALGVAGTVIGRVASYFEKRQENAFKEKEWEHNLKTLEIQREMAKEVANIDLAKIAAQGSYDGLTASIAAESAVGAVPPWVSAVRALIRPWITVFADAALIVFAFAFDNPAVRESLIDAVVFIAVTATVWWFGDRAPQGLRKVAAK